MFLGACASTPKVKITPKSEWYCDPAKHVEMLRDWDAREMKPYLKWQCRNLDSFYMECWMLRTYAPPVKLQCPIDGKGPCFILKGKSR